MKVRHLFLLSLMTIAGAPAQAQQDAHFSHYMLNQAFYNPAWLTQEQSTYISFLHRTQWAGYTTSFDGNGGAPSTQQFGFGMPLAAAPAAIGVIALRDQLAGLTNTHLQFLAAYYRNFGKGKLSLGIRPALVMQSIDFDQYRFVNPDDPFNKSGSESQLRPDVGLGVTYTTTGFYIGLAANHLFSPSFDFGVSQIENRLRQSINLMAGYSFHPTYNLEVTPSFLARSTFQTFTFDLSALATYKKKLWGGVSYRESEAVILLAGYHFMKDGILKVGYSFDYVVKDREAKQATSHEVFVRYKLGTSSGSRGDKIIRTPRFRF